MSSNEDQQISANELFAAIQKMENSFQRALQEVYNRVDEISRTQRRSRSRSPRDRPTEPERTQRRSHSRSPSPRRKEPERSRHWADRTDTVLDLPPIRDDEWAEEDEDGEEDRPFRLSEESKEAVKKHFTTTLENSQRREIRGRYPVLDMPEIRTPKLDDIFNASESKFVKNPEAKQVDKDLLQIQGYMLDTTHPLLCLLEGLKEGNLSSFDIHSLAMDALQLVGNAVCQTSQIRRKRVLKICNPDIATWQKETSSLRSLHPSCLGMGLKQR